MNAWPTRRAGLMLFSAALLAGGFATSQGLAAIGAGGPGHRWGAAVTIRIRREDLTGTAAAHEQPSSAEPAMEPASS